MLIVDACAVVVVAVHQIVEEAAKWLQKRRKDLDDAVALAHRAAMAPSAPQAAQGTRRRTARTAVVKAFQQAVGKLSEGVAKPLLQGKKQRRAISFTRARERPAGMEGCANVGLCSDLRRMVLARCKQGESVTAAKPISKCGTSSHSGCCAAQLAIKQPVHYQHQRCARCRHCYA